METVYEFIFKLVGRNTFVREWFYENTAAWKFILEWAGSHRGPPHPTQGSSSGVRLHKGRQQMNMAALQHMNE